MATKKQNRHHVIRKLRNVLKNSDVPLTNVGAKFNRIRYGSGASRQDIGKNEQE